jgi:hypothetical protein
VFDFANSPTVGQVVSNGGVSYTWDGAKWAPTAAGATGVSSFNTRTGAVTLSSGDVTGALTYTPYNSTNPSGYQTAAQVATAVAPYANNDGRNLIHNALFNIAQRGTGPFNSGGYTADRWNLALSVDTSSVNIAALGSTAITQIGDEAATNALSTTVAGNAGASAFTFVSHKIEDVRRLAGKTVTVSFWANAAGATKLGLNILQDFGSGGSPSGGVWMTAVSFTLTGTWTRYSATFALPSIAGKVLGTNNNHLTNLAFWMSSGSSSAAVAGNPGVQSGTINLWGVQLEIGSVATPLDYGGSPQQQLAECQRFYQTGSFTYGAYSQAGWGAQVGIMLPVCMRASPTIASNFSSAVNVTGQAITAAGASGVTVYGSTTATGQVNMQGTFAASADL